MSRNALKILAVIAMTVDHIALVFVRSDTIPYYIMRLFGRLAAPIMAFMLAQGFRHTRSRKRYLLRLFAFALISQPCYFGMVYQRKPCSAFEFLTNWNIMFTLAVSLAALCILDAKKLTAWKMIAAAVSISLAHFADWAFLIPAWVFIFRYMKPKARTTMLCYAAACVILQTAIFRNSYDSFAHFSFQFGTLLALIPLHFYNEKKNELKKKRWNRWGFYVYYPAHMLLLVLIRTAI